MPENQIRLRWDQKGLDRVNAAFAVDALSVRATFELGDHAWHASFKVKSDCSQDTVSLALSVFGGVFQAVREFLLIREPQVLIFVTDREELAEHYRSYLLKQQNTMEAMGYKLDAQGLTLIRYSSSFPRGSGLT